MSAKSRFVLVETLPIALGGVVAFVFMWLATDASPAPLLVALGTVGIAIRALASARAFEQRS